MNVSQVGRAIVKRGIRATMLGMSRGPHLSRFAMYTEISRAYQADVDMKGLSISGSDMLCSKIGLRDITPAEFPEYDIRNLNFDTESFDCVVSDQVLEHVEGDPFAAIEETRRILKIGGIALHATCLIHPIHNANGQICDFWRFTPEGLKFLCRNFSEVIDVRGWGNQFVPIFDWLGMRFDPVPLASWHPFHKLATHNDVRWPMVTWIIAKK